MQEPFILHRSCDLGTTVRSAGSVGTVDTTDALLSERQQLIQWRASPRMLAGTTNLSYMAS